MKEKRDFAVCLCQTVSSFFVHWSKTPGYLPASCTEMCILEVKEKRSQIFCIASTTKNLRPENMTEE